MRVGIIGGGAAGMMAAATINELHPETDVFLLEKNDHLGKKVLISGGGRCNVTTGIQDMRTVMQKYPRGGKFLHSAMYNFSPADVYAWFETHGVPLKNEPDNRVFPQSNNGHDVVGAFMRVYKEHNTKLLLTHAVTSITKSGAAFTIHCKAQDDTEVDTVVLALGGQAFRHTGSTGDGYTLAESLGHHVTPLAASLNSFFTQETWPGSLAGLSFSSAKLSSPRAKHYAFSGPFVFTHRGLSGPAVFALSSLIAFEEYNRTNPLLVLIDFIPDTSPELVTSELTALLSAHPKKSFKNTLHHFVPFSLAEVVCKELAIPLDKKNAEISKLERTSAERWLKSAPVHVIARGAGDEFVTAGGVELHEVNPKTMESTLCPGLFFAGEILNVDGYTGGFNLQASWATGRLAGEQAAIR